MRGERKKKSDFLCVLSGFPVLHHFCEFWTFGPHQNQVFARRFGRNFKGFFSVVSLVISLILIIIMG